MRIREKRGNSLIEQGSERGVVVDFFIDKKTGPIHLAILSKAKKMRSGMLAMASQSGPISALLSGSLVRKLVRESPVCMWIMHPKDFKKG